MSIRYCFRIHRIIVLKFYEIHFVFSIKNFILQIMAERVALDSNEVGIASQIQYQRSTSSLCIWTVRSYSKLDKDVLYYQTNDTKYMLKLMKTSHILFVSLYSRFPKLPNVKFLLIGSEDETYCCVATEIKACVYVAEFCDRVVSDPQKKFLVNDTITIHCVYPEKPNERGFTVAPYGEWRYKCCTDDLRDVLAYLYQSSDYHDCTITADGRTFKVHKPILVARSKFIASLLENGEKNIKIPFKAHILDEVLRYIYTGELKERSLEQMIEILEISQILQVTPLSKKCEDYLKSNLDCHNYIDIFNNAVKCNSFGLIKEAMYYFISNIEEFKECSNYEEICEIIMELHARPLSVTL